MRARVQGWLARGGYGCLGVTFLLSLSGCVSFSQLGSPFEPLLSEQRYDEALKALDRGHSFRREKVLYALDKGMLLRLKGDLAASNEALEQAKRGMEELDAVSVTEQFSAATVNDTLRKYAGASFERVLVHVYKALNYLELGRVDEARVEALQLDVLLKQLDNPPGSAFARYVSGLVFEVGHDWSDALIAYRKAFEAYQKIGEAIPEALKYDLLRLTRRQGLHDEYRRFAGQFGIELSDQDESAQGNVVLLLHSGLIPRKQEQAILVQSPSSGLMTRVATPFYETRWPAVSAARLRVGDKQITSTRAGDLGAMARRALEQDMPAIMARAVARVAAKGAVSRASGKNDEMVGLLVNIVGVITERADVRGWYTLPQAVLVARLRLPPGQYPVIAELLGGPGTVAAQRTFAPIQVTEEDTRVISLHWPITGGVDRRRR